MGGRVIVRCRAHRVFVTDGEVARADLQVHAIAFRDPQIGRKTLLASLAGLEVMG